MNLDEVIFRAIDELDKKYRTLHTYIRIKKMRKENHPARGASGGKSTVWAVVKN